MSSVIFYILLGIVAGVASGLLGLGGGFILVPAFIYLFGLSQHEAQGTTLALMVPPVGLLAAWSYYKEGNANLAIATCVCIGFFFGGLAGAKIASAVPDEILRKMFGVALLIASLDMILKR